MYIYKILFISIVFIHGIIHLIAFLQAWGFGNITQLNKNISKTIGICWLTTTILFIITIIMFLLHKDWWAFIAIATVVFSQVLIVTAWKNAKFGTIVNIIVITAVFLKDTIF